MSKSTDGLAPTKPSHANLPPALAALRAPNGRKLSDLSATEIIALGRRAGVAGISEENGRQANVEAFARHIDQIRTAAADAAVENWLRANA